MVGATLTKRFQMNSDDKNIFSGNDDPLYPRSDVNGNSKLSKCNHPGMIRLSHSDPELGKEHSLH